MLAAGAPPAIRFVGVVTESQETRLCLEDESTGAWSWVPVGGCFLDYTINTYEPAIEIAVLGGGDREYRVPLRHSRVIEAPADLSPATVDLIRENLLLFRYAAAVHIKQTRSRYVTYDDLVGAGKYLESLDPVAGEDYRGLTMMKGEANTLVVTTADGTKISY